MGRAIFNLIRSLRLIQAKRLREEGVPTPWLAALPVLGGEGEMLGPAGSLGSGTPRPHLPSSAATPLPWCGRLAGLGCGLRSSSSWALCSGCPRCSGQHWGTSWCPEPVESLSLWCQHRGDWRRHDLSNWPSDCSEKHVETKTKRRQQEESFWKPRSPSPPAIRNQEHFQAAVTCSFAVGFSFFFSPICIFHFYFCFKESIVEMFPSSWVKWEWFIRERK